jgi:hypothetical protein
MQSSSCSIARGPISLLFACVTRPTIPTRRPTGRRRRSIVLWAAGSSGITSKSFRLAGMVNGWMVASSLHPLGLMPRYLRPTARVHLNARNRKYLDAVHMDIAFGDCLSVGGFRYALSLVDQATRYKWAFGLQSFLSDAILSAIRLFWAVAGSLARCFYCDCDRKLFGMAISEYLIDNHSKVVVAPAKH